MERNKGIGVIRESDSAESPVAVIRVTEKVYPSSFVLVREGEEVFLALVLDVWGEGGVFTRDTSTFHIDHCDEAADRTKSTYKVARLRPVARVDENGRLSGANERILIFPGATLFQVSSDQLRVSRDGVPVSK